MWKCVGYIFLQVICWNLALEYGPFNISLKTFEFCKGPKPKDCTTGTTIVNSDSTADVEMVVIQSMIPTRGKVVASSSMGKDPMRLQLSKPCDSLFIKSMLQTLFSVSDKCLIPKGKYKFHLNFLDMMRKYYGGKHFYGEWKIKTLVYNDHCNFACTLTEVLFSPA